MQLSSSPMPVLSKRPVDRSVPKLLSKKQTTVFAYEEVETSLDNTLVRVDVGREPDMDVFYFHKHLLEARSIFCRAKFHGLWSDKLWIKLTDEEPDVFRWWLSLLYFRRMSIRPKRDEAEDMTGLEMGHTVFERLVQFYALCDLLQDDVVKDWCLLGAVELYRKAKDSATWGDPKSNVRNSCEGKSNAEKSRWLSGLASGSPYWIPTKPWRPRAKDVRWVYAHTPSECGMQRLLADMIAYGSDVDLEWFNYEWLSLPLEFRSDVEVAIMMRSSNYAIWHLPTTTQYFEKKDPPPAR